MNLKIILNKIRSITEGYKKSLCGYIKKYKNYKKQEKALARQYQVEQNTFLIAQQIQSEMYDVFRRFPHSFLLVNFPEEFRYVGCRILDGGFLYSFEILTLNPPNTVVLLQYKETLASHIAQFQQQSILHLGYDVAWNLYPCIMAGLYIMNIKLVGSQIHFDVATLFAP
ncbi:MAG: hypothetical protein IJZ53_12775 [Tyzzerella sp.]|nr:hypothetical protein [Tyzzerella sp.]